MRASGPERLGGGNIAGPFPFLQGRSSDQRNEAEMSTDKGNPDHEGGHMSSTFGRIVRTSDTVLPYKVVLSHDQCAETERSFATMQEAEAFIRRNTPPAKPRSTFWDRDAPKD
jgi:hypothetical protein